MARPGTQIIARDSAPPRTPPTDTGTWFVAGPYATGPSVPTLLTSLKALVDTYGVRTAANAAVYDSIETFFRLGGSKVYFQSHTATTPTPTQITAAINSFGPELGPGQISAPGNVDPVIAQALLTHAQANNRRAVIDAPNDPATTNTSANVTTARALTDKTLVTFGATFAPWLLISGLTPGTTRTIPPCGAVAGKIAANDALTSNPNLAAAGVRGDMSGVILGETQAWTDTQRDTLTVAGVNVIKDVFGAPRIYGFRTMADKTVDLLNWQLSNSRLDMAIQARAGVIAENFMFRGIDGRGITLSQFNAALVSLLGDFYALGALYGTTADEAFRVDTGPTVNTTATIADGQLHAVLAIRRSPFAELVVIEIVKSAIDQAV